MEVQIGAAEHLTAASLKEPCLLSGSPSALAPLLNQLGRPQEHGRPLAIEA